MGVWRHITRSGDVHRDQANLENGGHRGSGVANDFADGAFAGKHRSGGGCIRADRAGGDAGKQGIAPGADLHVNERTIGEVLNDAVEVPVLVGDVSRIVEKIKPTESPLTFKTEGLGRPAEVTLVAYYRVAHERYNMYWKVVNA